MGKFSQYIHIMNYWQDSLYECDICNLGKRNGSQAQNDELSVIDGMEDGNIESEELLDYNEHKCMDEAISQLSCLLEVGVQLYQPYVHE